MDNAPAIVAVALVGFALVSGRLSASWVTGTMVFTGLGLLIGPEVFDLVDVDGLLGSADIVTLLLTATLVIVLFTDASAINSSNWRDDVIPARLLGIGLPLAIGLGWVAALLVVGDLEIWEAAVLATMLAPTDAALGKAVVSNPRVPVRIRQALNIESGLNDGIALPVFVVFLEAARVAEDSLPLGDIVTELVQEVGIALLVGIAVGWLGALAIRWGRLSGQAIGYWLQISLVLLAGSAYAIAVPLGGSGFIAAWVAGFVFGRRFDSTADPDLPEYAEATGDLLTIGSFLVFGIYLGPVLTDLTWQVVVYAIISLVVVRLLAVTIALAGTDLRWPSVVYIGWFGPRGLATIILTIEIIGETELAGAPTITDAALVTVALSVVAHGMTAWWGSNRYADLVERHPRRTALIEAVDTGTTVRVPLRSHLRREPQRR